jgi:hypothetical protein
MPFIQDTYLYFIFLASLYLWVYFLVLCSIPLVCFFAYKPVSCCYDYYRFVIKLRVWASCLLSIYSTIWTMSLSPYNIVWNKEIWCLQISTFSKLFWQSFAVLKTILGLFFIFLWKNDIENFIRTILNLWTLWVVWTFLTIFILLIHEHGISFHLFVSYRISLISVL